MFESLHLVQEKRLRRKKRKSLLGRSVLVLSSFVLLFAVAFAVFELPIAYPANLSNFAQTRAMELVAVMPPTWQSKVAEYLPSLPSEPLDYEVANYTMLAPVVVALGYALGPRLVLLVVGMYLALGILGPFGQIFPFADGGGLDYYLKPGFGYLIGLLTAGWVTARITINKRTSLSQAVGIIAGLLALHLIGALYLFGTYLFFYLTEGSKSYLEWQPWIFQYVRNLTWNNLPYDVIFSFFLVGASFPIRWLAKTLTIPYDSPKNGRRSGYEDRMIEGAAEEAVEVVGMG